MARIGIYVPDDMKSRMDKVGEDVNWSSIAQRSFETELKHLEAVKGTGSMEGVIERLKASKDKFMKETLSDGRQSGVDWAQQHAEYQELRRIAEFDKAIINAHNCPDDFSAATALYTTVVGEEYPDKDEIAHFLMIDEDEVERVTREFLDGFIDGAQDVWNEVSDRL